MNFSLYTTDQVFPDNDYRGVIGSAALLTDSCFNAAFFTQGVSPSDKDLFRNGTVRYGVFVREHIPFIIIQVGSVFSFEITINLVGIPQEATERWLLDSKANAINLFLVNQPRYILAAIRTIGVDLAFMAVIKNTLKRQVVHYRESDQVVEAVSSIEKKFSNSAMIARTFFYKHEEVG